MTHPPTTDETVDQAAGLLAQHGTVHPSLQRVAYAVAFSKTGLLQHFPSRASLHEAAMDVSRRHVLDLLVRLEALPPGFERDRALVEDLVDFALEWPGVSALAQNLALGQEPQTGPDVELERQAFTLLPLLGIDPGAVDHVRVVNLTCALAGLHSAVQALGGEDPPERWRDLVVAASLRTLGHVAPVAS